MPNLFGTLFALGGFVMYQRYFLIYATLNNDFVGLINYFCATQTTAAVWVGTGLSTNQLVVCFFRRSM